MVEQEQPRHEELFYLGGCAEDIDIIPQNDTNVYRKDVWMVHEWVRKVVWVEKRTFR